MASNLTSERRKGESVLTGGRTIRKAGSRSSSQDRRTRPQSVPLLEFLDNILKFSKVLLRQEDNPLRQDLVLGLTGDLEILEEQVADVATDQKNDSGIPSPKDEDWSANCSAIKMQLNRLVMWRFDVTQKKLTPALKEESPVYSVICESILGIGEILKSRKSLRCCLSSVRVPSN